MKPFSRMFLYASLGLATLTMGCAEMNGGATGASGSPASPSSNTEAKAVTTGPTRVSTGTQGDTLEACLSRIPSDATAGQKMLATMSCERDAKARTSIDAVPGK
ncbi:MAG: hypothetical protein H6750_15055 [Nitrospiraceae bacterium]|nr:hypothetical protein [Nitrospira sp.]MCA9455685.1 hypothetical protein [Nitrospira sp.]MCB9775626.1 hypothetical protein [Nitrospiraceae bacterium]